MEIAEVTVMERICDMQCAWLQLYVTPYVNVIQQLHFIYCRLALTNKNEEAKNLQLPAIITTSVSKSTWSHVQI